MEVVEAMSAEMLFPDILLCPRPPFDVDRAAALGLSVPALRHLIANTKARSVGSWEADPLLDAQIDAVLQRLPKSWTLSVGPPCQSHPTRVPFPQDGAGA